MLLSIVCAAFLASSYGLSQAGIPSQGESPGSPWQIHPLEYLEAPGASVLVFHDTYPEGKQGGIQLILHGERIATNGDLRLEPIPGQWAPLPRPGKREVDPDKKWVSVPLSFSQPALKYTLRLQPEGDSIRLSVDLESPLAPEFAGKLGLNLELFPSAFFGKTYQLGDRWGMFPRQPGSPVERTADGRLAPTPLGRGARLVIAPEDPLRHVEIEQVKGEMMLFDGRTEAQNGWFVVRSEIPAGANKGALEWIITPHRIKDWRRAPVIGVSQVGYHPLQQKRAVIELEAGAAVPAQPVLRRVDPKGGMTEAFSAPVEKWGKFLRFEYAIFDFSRIQAPGFYSVVYGEHCSPVFRIGGDIFKQDVWQPTLEFYFPIQMCHMEVREAYRIWHGACHLDDALHAPTSHEHFDSYRQSAQTAGKFGALEHIPGLASGGWHDAGDYDLAAGSQAETTFVLALIDEVFQPNTDQVTVKPTERSVLLHTPDGVSDLKQQIAHGVESLLGGYRAVGYSFAGIIEADIRQYVHLGDASTMTDNRIYDAALAAGQTAAERSTRRDDRWVFTDKDTSLEYKVATALAAASRSLRKTHPELADEALQTATRVWDYEQSHPPVRNRNAYVPGRVETQEVLATTELLSLTGEAKYRTRLIALLPVIQRSAGEVGWAVSRVYKSVGDDAFAAAVDASLKEYAGNLQKDLAGNPYGVPFRPAIWGVGWNLQQHAMRQYFLNRAHPQLFDRENVLRVLNFVWGCHPGSDVSFVSGVGTRSMTIAYGTNRADWSYIPGGVVSGTNLVRPDFPELKDNFPFLWQQAEYVMGGAATYIFCVLAADALLNAGK